MKSMTFLTMAGLWSGFLAAQPQPVQWHHLDPKTDSVMGISTNRAYQSVVYVPHRPHGDAGLWGHRSQ